MPSSNAHFGTRRGRGLSRVDVSGPIPSAPAGRVVATRRNALQRGDDLNSAALLFQALGPVNDNKLTRHEAQPPTEGDAAAIAAA